MKLNNLFIPIRKVDAENRLIYGVLAAEVPDLSGEILDYESSKAAIQAWSDGISKNTDGKSKGNLRVMHGPKVAGKFTQVVFNDELKQVEVVAQVIDDAEWKMVESGSYSGLSIGAHAGWRKKDEENPKLTRYSVKTMIEGSLVDLPCIPSATFELIKNGQTELRKFQNSPTSQDAAYVPHVSFKKQFRTVHPLLEKVGSADRMRGFVQKAARSAGIRKSLWDASELACCLMSINSIRLNLKYEAEWEQDDSALPEELRTWLDAGAKLLEQLVAEESSELTSDAPSVQPEDMIAMAAEADIKKNEEAKMAEEIKTPEVPAEAPVEKAATVEVPETNDVEKSVEALVQKKFDEAVSKLTGKIDEQETVLKSLTESVKTISELLSVLKTTPAPVKGVSAQAITVTKAQDGGEIAKEAPKDAMSAFKMALAPENGKSLR